MNNKKTKYTVSIIENGTITSYSLSSFSKNEISFGRDSKNDIVLNSPVVSAFHGHFTIENNTVTIHDDNSLNGFFINSFIKKESFLLHDGDIVKIDNPEYPLYEGILMYIDTNENKNKWVEYDLSNKNKIYIGRSKECDIKLDKINISSKHAKLIKNGNNYSIDYEGNNIGILLNNAILSYETPLRDKDVFEINGIKFIYSQNKIFYQLSYNGVRIDAFDIVKTVRLKFKKKDISQHIDFSAEPGQFVAFVGGSGAGKSTFMKCISGVTKPTSGKVLINGNDLYTNYDVLKNLIGYVPQENIIFDDLTLIKMLRYAANLRMPDDSSRAEKEKRIEDVLTMVEMLDKKDVMIKNLSGGQQKRACIAVELIADPNLFFLDEPTSGLDPGTERNLMKTLRKMADSGKTIILVTHNTLNLHLCDKVVFFGYGGKICFDGAPSDALNFFEVDDFVDIYNIITNEPDKWHKKFNESKYATHNTIPQSQSNNYKGKKSKKFLKQFFTLLTRKINMLVNNKQQMLLLFGQAPLIAFLLSFVVTDNLFYSYEDTKAILFTFSTAAIWIGLLNSIQEICKERVILEKEYMANLRISSYIASKVVYLLLIAFIQSILLLVTFTLVVEVPQTGLLYNWFIDSLITIFLTITSASTIGLLVSAFSKDSAVALTMPAILLVPQLLFSGMLFPLDGIVDKVSNFILSRWSVEALGTINDLNSLVGLVQEAIPGYVRTAESYYEFTLEHLYSDLGIITIMSLIFIIASYIILRIQMEKGK
ncbi:MAG: ATP-binding cassette domain-containing protein [Candidatus Coprovivens sp.]